MCSSTCFGRFSAHHQERTAALGASGFTVGAWRLERCWLWSTPMVKPEAPSCSCTLLMMGGEAPKTRWAIYKRQVINLWNCFILLVDLFQSHDDARTCKRKIYECEIPSPMSSHWLIILQFACASRANEFKLSSQPHVKFPNKHHIKMYYTPGIVLNINYI
jgi:hypothetical protein